MENYKIIHSVGKGAFGNVYLSKNKKTQQHVVIKQIPMESISIDEKEVTRNEIKVLSMLVHPNIIEYYDSFVDNHAIMIVMEYAPGGNLFDFIQTRGQGNFLQEEEVLHLFAQLVLGLQHIHLSKILHRDLKTHNILLIQYNYLRVKIGDFGISKIMTSKSKANTVVGTPCYFSPEVCHEKPYNQKSDIWALGCILYEMLALHRAFEADGFAALIFKIMNGAFSPLPPHYSGNIKSLVHLLLDLDPSQRPSIHQILSLPQIFTTVSFISTDYGMLPCKSRSSRLSTVISPSSLEVQFDQTDNDSISKNIDKGCFTPNTPTTSYAFVWPYKSHPLRLSNDEGNITLIKYDISNTHLIGVTNSGSLAMWDIKRLHGEQENSAGQENDMRRHLVPTIIKGPHSLKIVQVSCGKDFYFCITDKGVLLSCGDGSTGCLGHGNTNSHNSLKSVDSLIGVTVTEVSCGLSHVAVITADCDMYVWGEGDHGKLGIKSSDTHLWPQKIDLENNVGYITSVLCGYDCTFISTSSNKVLACGNNRYNKLGIDESDNDGKEIIQRIEEVSKFVPLSSKPLTNCKITKIATGLHHSAFINENGELFTCGDNSYGQLGSPGLVKHRVPDKVIVCTDDNFCMDVTCGSTYTVAIMEDSKIYAWGRHTKENIGMASNLKSANKTSETSWVSDNPKQLNFSYKISSKTRLKSSDNLILAFND